MRKEKGITLIALVITIIVLLILAGVTIATLTGENGILSKANSAKEQTEAAKKEEEERLKEYEKLLEEAGGNKTLPSTADTTPFLPEGATVLENDIDKGVVIKDSKGNEWVWIEVPKSIYTNTTYNSGTAPTSEKDYKKIESIMQNYAKDYRRSEYTDTFYSTEQHGFSSSTDYDNWKNSMLESVFNNGGFYIGRYEMGTETARFSASDSLTTPLIKQDMYPYNYITCSQAQTLAKQLAPNGKTSSLMFGIQWDLVLKYIETKGGKTQEELKTDSTTWGNYSNATFNLTRGKYLSESTWNNITTYNKPASAILLSTGATTRNSTLNIYDLAGNLYEWTLEMTSDTKIPCTFRGGNYSFSGSDDPPFNSYRTNTSYSFYSIGARPSLW